MQYCIQDFLSQTSFLTFPQQKTAYPRGLAAIDN